MLSVGLTGWKMDLAAVALGRIVAEPVLEECGASKENDISALVRVGPRQYMTHGIGVKRPSILQRRWTERIKPNPLPRMHHRQLPSHCQDSPFTRRIRQLRRRTTDQSNHTRSVDHASVLLPTLPHTEHRMLTPEPHALDIDIVSQIPDLLGGVDGVRVLAVHDASVVEHDVNAAPGVEVRDHGGDVGFFGDIAFDGLETGMIGDGFLDLGYGFGEGGFGNVGHEDGSAFTGEEDGGFETDSAGERTSSSATGSITY